MDMAKEKKECEIMTMLIIMKKVINPLEVGEEEEVETILEEQMQRGMINPMLNVIIVISMVIFLLHFISKKFWL